MRTSPASSKDVRLPLAPAGTPFQLRCGTSCDGRYGETATYGEIARRLGMTGQAARAVGLANGRNPMPIVIPCHRVVGADGRLTGYAGGTSSASRLLLDLEQGALFAPRQAWPASGRPRTGHSAARRSDSESRSAAASTAGACIRPGCRVSRSSGPETETAAMILPEGERTGAETDATPCLALADRLGPAASADAGERGGGVGGVLQATVHPLGVLPGEQNLGGGAGAHRQLGADRDGVAQARGPLGGGDADAVLALAAPQLGGLAGDVAQPRQHGPGGGEQPVLAGGGAELGQPGAEDEPPCMSRATRRWCSRATARRWAVGRARPVPATSPARVAGPDSRAESTRAALSRTPTPLELSII